MSLKLSAIPATAVSLAPSDLLYLAKDMGGSFLEHKLPVSVLDAKYQATLGFTPVPNTRLINTTAPLTGGGDLSADRTLAMPAATGAVDGYLTSANFTTFNNKGDAFTTNPLSQFAPTTSAQLAGVISDETGTNLLVFNTNPTLAGATVTADLILQDSLNTEATSASIGTNQNNYDPGATSYHLIDATSSFILTGITGGVNGRILRISNTSLVNTITVNNNSGSSTAGNRIRTGAVGGAGAVGLGPSQTLTLIYDATATIWRAESIGYTNNTFALTTSPLSQFAATTSAQLAGVISDETGSGLLVFNTNPTIAGATFSAALNMGSNLINNVTDPVGAQDAATKAYVDSVASAPPFVDTTALVMGSVDATKLLRFEVDGFTTATTRVLTPPNANATIAGLEVAQTFTAVQTMGANLLFTPDNTFDIGATLATRPRTVYAGTSVDVERPSLGVTTASAIQVENPTAAALNVLQVSPAVRWEGQGFSTDASASRSTEFRAFVVPAQGAAAPIPFLVFQSSVNGAAFTTVLSMMGNGALLIGAQAPVSTAYAPNNISMFAGTGIDDMNLGSRLRMGDDMFLATTVAGSTRNIQFYSGGTVEVLAQGQTGLTDFAVYNTKTSETNFERLDIEWTSNVCRIWTEKGSGGGTARDLVIGADATEVIRFTSADMKMATAKTLSIASGTNTRAGNAVLVAGTVTVSNTTVTANTIVMLTRKTSGGTLGTAITYTVSAATSFTINSDSALDTSTFSYFLIERP